MRIIYSILIIFFSSQLLAQGLFDDAVTDESKDSSMAQKKTYELNGHVRGVFYGGKNPEEDEAEIKSGYSEVSLKLRVRNQDLGDGFAEIRFRRGHEFSEHVSEFNLREAYINTYIGCFDFCLGQQIVVWGRADGFNPTDNITPKNMLARSPDEDDRREGNFLFRSFYNAHPFRIECIWVPAYSASVIPTNFVSLPAGVTFIEPNYPDANLKNSSFAAKLNLEPASFDCSVSYFNGYNPFPGIDAVFTGGTEINLILKAYRMHVVGADFSTTIGSIGFRGEFAYKDPHRDHKSNLYIPNPDLQYTIGCDKESGDFYIILQYIGRYVFDFTELTKPITPEEMMSYELSLNNRMFSSQQDEISHSISFRPAWKLMYETLNLELFGLYNFTTEELFLKPKASYYITDALKITLGGEIYTGPDNTLFGTIDSYLSSFFIELRTSF